MIGSTDRFSYEWSKFNKIIPDYEIQFKRWIYPLLPKDFKNKSVLDAGCGTGRNTYWALRYGSKSIIALDYDEKTLNVTKKNLAEFKNAKTVYKSIYNISYKESFDIVFCIGVLHHLENPRLAIEKLVKATKKGGKILIWVYGYEGNEWIKKYINPVRFFTSKLPLPIADFISFVIAFFLMGFLKLFPPHKTYLRQLSGFSFWHIHSIVFDQLIPRIANYWTKAEAFNLLKRSDISKVHIHHTNDNSWTVIGTKI